MARYSAHDPGSGEPRPIGRASVPAPGFGYPPAASRSAGPPDAPPPGDGYPPPWSSVHRPAAPPPPPPEPPRRRRTGVVVAVAVVFAVLAAAGTLAALRPGPIGALLGGAKASPPTSPSAEPSPSPVLNAIGASGPLPTTAGLTARLAPLLADPRLGLHTTVRVVDLATGQPLFARTPDAPTTPASTLKLVTGAAVLQTRGPAYRIETKVVAGAQPGEVVLVGGGDPTLSVDGHGSYPGAAKLSDLAAAVKQAGVTPTKVVVDSSLYVGPSAGPGWLPGDLTEGYVGRITALMTDGGRIQPQVLSPSDRYAQPDLAAGRLFARLLGVPATAVTLGTAPPNARTYGSVLSPTIDRIVETMLTNSDNVLAEAMARQVALAKGLPASFAGETDAIRRVIGDLGVPAGEDGQVDGSGMSLRNKITPTLLTDLLVAAAKPGHPNLWPLFTGMPVAGYSGTLDLSHYTGAVPGAGVLRAKTGTLSGVNALAGVLVDADGRALAFAFLADNVGDPEGAVVVLHSLGGALAGCGCR